MTSNASDLVTIWVESVQGSHVTGTMKENPMKRATALVRHATDVERVKAELVRYIPTLGAAPPEVAVPISDIVNIIPS